MKKLVAVLAILMAISCGISSTVSAEGPAPNSGDGISDGSGMDSQNGPNGNGESRGPAPSSGDGDPDGPGW